MTPTIIPFETSKCKGLFVVVPEGAKDIDIISVGFSAPLELGCSFEDGRPVTLTLPQGNWHPLGLLNEIPEEQAADVVDEGIHPADDSTAFFCYTEWVQDFVCADAKTAIISLARSLNVPENSVVLIEKK